MAEKTVDLDPRDAASLGRVLSKRYARVLKDETFEIRADGDREGVEIHCRLAKPDRTWVLSLKVRAQVQDFSSRPKATESAVDVVGFVLEKLLLGKKEKGLPLDWQKINYAGENLYFCGQIRNEVLEEAADALLLQNGFKLEDEDV